MIHNPVTPYPMSMVRRLAAIAIMAMGMFPGINGYNQLMRCGAGCLHRSAADHVAGISGVCPHPHSAANHGPNHGFFGLCSQPSEGDVLLPPIDSDDDWALPVLHGRSNAHACSSAGSCAYHHAERVAASSPPRYLLTSALLL